MTAATRRQHSVGSGVCGRLDQEITWSDADRPCGQTGAGRWPSNVTIDSGELSRGASGPTT
jgi:hypothetical protein